MMMHVTLVICNDYDGDGDDDDDDDDDESYSGQQQL